MAGSGKTQLALRYCERQSARRRFIFWINAESEQSTRRAFSSLADDFAAQSHIVMTSSDLDAKVRYAVRSMSDLKSPWILVFDNYDDPASFPGLRSFMPSITSSACGTVLVTSRHLDVVRLGGSKIEVGPMEEEEGIDLLLARACPLVSTENRNLARPIVCRLGGLALALDQAGSYLQKTRIPLPDFNEHFEAQKNYMLRHTPLLWNYTRQSGEGETESRLNVFTTWELSFKFLQRISRPYQVDFTMLLGFLHCTSISEKLFRIHHKSICLPLESEGATAEFTNSGSQTWSEGFTDQVGRWNWISFRTFLSTLHNLSLIQGFSVIEDKICLFALHPVVADWIKLRVDICARKRYTIEAASICHSVIVSDELSEFSPKDKQDLLRHMDECLKNEAFDRAELCSQTIIVNSFADFYHSQGRYEQAAGLYQQLLEHPFCVDPIQQARINHVLAILYHSLGRYQDAESLHRRVLAEREAHLGRAHKETLCTIESLANLYRSGGRYSEAENLYTEVLKERENLLGVDDPDTMQVVSELANNRRSEGRYEDAENLYRRALAVYESKLGHHHSTTITLVNDMASCFQSQGRYFDAEVMYLRALKERRTNLGDTHPDTLWTMADLANNFQSQGRYHEAETLYRKTVSCDELVYGMDHPETLWALDGLANVVRQQHHYDEAQSLYERALSGREKRLGFNHHNTLRTLVGLGLVFGEQGKLDEAEPLYERALQGFRQQFGPDHPKTLNVIHILAQNYASKGAYTEAEELYLTALAGLNIRLGPDHARTLQVAHHLETLSCIPESQLHTSCS
ncbi:uncharacterized protein A1O9_00680 [Exophiala aquamarina CBS 119918]|uniref:Uncharacterized protein n=1 Tax=Exophiala aquamarina CBS 119918 TaxID=1182545 RepID=A0A072PSH0_9EURO|nr:uncharacterized protein A1O9_00680 [Exophiala aquamarina CBS 119918]KEF62707.1 hypothetical protein A1O9_00680 [Exophiala aquamarina CBS 119918]